MWKRETSLPDHIQSAWEDGDLVQHLGDISYVLKRMTNSLKKWSHDKFTAVTKELMHIRKKMEELSKHNHATSIDELEKL
jgi:CO dehydrogenase/acetyl-CoA synthase epsilon subunit